MGGFIGGVVRADKRLSPDDFATIVNSIQRRGAGPAFRYILHPQELASGTACRTFVYLASAQESGLTENGALGAESPVSERLTMIDGFPADRSISELTNEVATQRTVVPKGDSDFISQLINDNGPFAFATVDSKSNRITIGRDLLGRKTIYYFETSDVFWFSTDLPSLLAVRAVPRVANPNTVYEYLRHGSWNTYDQSLFAHVSQIPPGTVMEVDLSAPFTRSIIERRQFQIPDILQMGFDAAVEATRASFFEAIERCIPLNNQPIGTSLSGGKDSSSIVAAMRHITGPDREIHSFSFIAPGHQKIDEEPWIDIAAESARTVSHKLAITSSEYARDLSAVTKEFGEPLIGVSQYLQYRLGSLMKDSRITTSIDGVLGDSVTGGQPYFVFDRLRRAILDRHPSTAAALTLTILRQITNGPSRGYFVQALAQLPDPIHRLIRTMLKLEVMPGWMDGEWFAKRGAGERLPSAFRGANPLQDHIVASSVGSRAVRSAERNASIFAANSRMPFLDEQFVAHMLSLPERYNFGNRGEERRVFTAAMKPFVPDRIINRTDKVGFNAPDNFWLSQQRHWANEILANAKLIGLPFKLDHLPNDIAEQKVNRSDIVRCISLAIWAECHGVDFGSS